MTDTTQVRVALRHLDPETDFPVLTTITNAAVAADRVQERLTEQQIRLDLGAEEKFDPIADFRVAEVDGVPVAFCKVEFIDTNDGLREYRSWCEVHPDWRRRRVGSTLFAWARQRIDELSASHDVDRPRVAGCWGSVTDLGADPMYRAAGYEPARYFFHMNRDLSQPIEVPPLPEGLEIRPVTNDDARRLFVADNEAFLDHWGGVDTSEAQFQKWIADDDWNPALHVVAFDGDEIAGAVINAIYPKANAEMGVRHGWLDSVFTRRPWRRRGLARALVARSLVVLRDQGMAEGILGVDAENPTGALGVYTDNGFVVTERFIAYRRPLGARA
ncbi:MAG TPA: GNAT family N-acetyltransferase [Candidatus Limnocylindria bacterium]|jgi:GNAT superfamily N-acetyltransferase